MIEKEIPSLRPGFVLTGHRRYVIEKVLGSGGFGITYLASTELVVENIRVTAHMAIKEHFVSLYNEREATTGAVTTPGSQKLRDMVANARKDFLGEARRLQQLCAVHPNIVKVNEVFEANGTAYYVMEYLEGPSLWDAVAGHGIGEAEMLTLILPVVDAAAHLHRNRLTHLDIKPQNIMLAPDGYGGVRPVLIDFGLSKHYDAQGHATSTINTLACSDGYSPLEQYSGITTFTPSADVYTLGATMLACLTGHTPPKSPVWPVGERMRCVAGLNVSRTLREVLSGALADSDNRYPDAGALLAALPGSLTAQIREAYVKPTPAPVPAAPVPVPPPAPVEDAAVPMREPLKPEHKDVPEPKPKKHRLDRLDFAVAGFLLFVGLVVLLFVWAPWKAGRYNLYLATERNGIHYYFSQKDWFALEYETKSEYRKLGIVIDYDGVAPFILGLDHLAGGERMTWYEAMARYSDQMPTKRQGEAIAGQRDAVQRAIGAFGGSVQYDSFWTKTEYDSSSAWNVRMFNGSVVSYSKTYTGRARAVAPAQPSSAR